jgi:hypothetical protein
VEQMGTRTHDLCVANGKIRVLWITKKHVNFVTSPNKNAAANKDFNRYDYDLELPILTKFGNVLATELDRRFDRPLR